MITFAAVGSALHRPVSPSCSPRGIRRPTGGQTNKQTTPRPPLPSGTGPRDTHKHTQVAAATSEKVIRVSLAALKHLTEEEV